jgi:presequence protease
VSCALFHFLSPPFFVSFFLSSYFLFLRHQHLLFLVLVLLVVCQHLLTHFYCFSGGDPIDITKLTFSQFKAFHEAYYHPKNARVFFYGNDDLTQRLEVLDEYLRDFDQSQPLSALAQQLPDSRIAWQRKRSLPRDRLSVPFPVSAESEDAKHMVALNWLVNDQPLTAKDLLAIELTDYLLLGASFFPFPASMLFVLLLI